jgi:hypothetical protein
LSKTYDSKCFELAKHFYPNASAQELSDCAGDIQDAVESFGEWMNREPPDPDGECYRSGEYAASVQRELAEARKLK